MIYILEDNEDRVRQFQSIAATIAPGVPIRVWRNAHHMIADLTDALEHASIISLDHDLNPLPTDTDDPGTGYDVAKLLEDLIPCCPIVIHTSNGERGTWMEGALSRAGWKYERVYPYGEDWIAKSWAPVVRRLLGLTPCPCCGFLTSPEDWDICPVCFWENDPSQFASPDQPGGANNVSLRQAQKNFVDFGASERDMVPHVRPTGFIRDKTWRPLSADQ